jgi:hypothetical protein
MGFWSRVRNWFRPRADMHGYTGSSVYPIGFDATAPRAGTRELWRMYRKSPWVFAITDRLAHERATKTRLTLWDGAEDEPTRTRVERGSPAYEILACWRRPIRVSSGQVITPRQRNKLLSSWWDGVGEAYCVKQRGAGGRVVGLVPINPLWVLKKPTVDEPTYTVTPDGSEAQFITTTTTASWFGTTAPGGSGTSRWINVTLNGTACRIECKTVA